jgi:hypothetical protein
MKARRGHQNYHTDSPCTHPTQGHLDVADLPGSDRHEVHRTHIPSMDINV